jgi:TP901 family phage tail tape measure protein
MGTRVENIRTNVYINDVNAGKSIRQLGNEARKLRNELALMKPGTQEFINKAQELRAVETRLRSLNNEVRGLNGSWSKAANAFNKYAALATAATAAMAGFAISIMNVIKRNAELSDSLANVMKTTGLTEKEVQELSTSLQKLNTRTSRKELLELAEEAGRLGKTGKTEILEFVKAANQIKVALGDDLGGTEALRDVGKLTEQFRVAQKAGVSFEEGMLKLGSAMNEVAASGSNQAAFHVDLMQRLSGIAGQAGLTADQVIGLAAALDEGGQSAEVAGTTLSKLFVDMFTNSAEYAKIAKMDVQEFTELLNTDANAALLKLLEGLRGNNEGFGVMAAKLDDLGLDGARAIGVLANMSQNLENIAAKQGIANKAMEDGTSITNEYSIKNENLAAGWERLQRAVAGAFINNGFTGALKDIVFWLNKLIEVPVSETMEEERMAMLGLKTQLLDTNIPTERRVEIINELKEQYPGYLGQIDAEKTTNEELIPILDEINSHMIKRIALQTAQEKLQTQQEGYAKAIGRQAAYMDELAQLTAKVAEENNIKLKEGVDLITQAKMVWTQMGEPLFGDAGKIGRLIYNDVAGTQKVINAYTNSVNDALKSVQRISEEIDKTLGIEKLDGNQADAPAAKKGDTKEIDGVTFMFDGSTWKPLVAPGGGGGDSAKVDKAKQIEQQIAAERIRLMEETEAKEMAALDERYRRMMEQEGITAQQKLQLNELYNQEKLAIELKWDQKAAEEGLTDNLTTGMITLEQQLQQELITIDQYNLQKLELEAAHLAAMLAIKQQYGEDTLTLEKEIAEKYTQIYNAKKSQQLSANKELVKSDAVVRDAKIDGLSQSINAVTAYVERSSDLFKALFVAEKASAIAQLIINLQKEISAIITHNTAKFGPLAGLMKSGPEVIAAKIRAGVGVGIIGAQTVGTLKGYAEGGFTGFGFGAPDSTGFKPAGVVHEGEYVIPKWMLQDRYVANVAGMLENIRTTKGGFAEGGPTSTVVEKHNTTNTTVIDQANVERLLQLIAERLERPSIVVMPDKTVRDINERMTKDSIITNRSKLN